MNTGSVQVNVRMRGSKVDKVRKFSKWAKGRVSEHFARFSEYVRRVDVFLRDLNGPKGGNDQNLMLAVRLRNGGTVAVRVVGDDLGRVLDTGIDRGLFSLSRKIDRMRTHRVKSWKYVPEWLNPEAG